MSATLLVNELSSLITDAKRKRSDLKKAAESSLESIESRKNLSRDNLTKYLLQNQNFASPFIIACASKESKILRAGVTGLEQLIALRAISEDALQRLVETLQGLTSSGQEIQLKLVQCLQKLDENYSGVLRGDLLSKILNLCLTIESNGDGGAPRAATAAFQQHIGSLFEAIKSAEIPQEDQALGVSAINDGEKVLLDLCNSIQGRQTYFLKFSESRNRLNLELLDVLLPNYSNTFLRHKGLAESIRGLLLPYLIKNLKEHQDYQLACIVARLTCHLLQDHLDQYISSVNTIISCLDDEILLIDTPFWKRALCLEAFVKLHGAPGFIRNVFTQLGGEEGGTDPGLQPHFDMLQVVIDNSPDVFGAHSQSQTHAKRSSTSRAPTSRIDLPHTESSFKEYLFSHNLTTSSRIPPCIAQNDKKVPTDLPVLYLHRLALSTLIQSSREMKSCISSIAFPGSKDVYEQEASNSINLKIAPSELISLPQSSTVVKGYYSFMRKYGEDLLDLHCRFLFAPFDLPLQEKFVMSFGDLFFVAKICGLKRGALQILRNLCRLASSSQSDSDMIRTMAQEDQRLAKASVEARSLSCLDSLSSLSVYLGSVLDVAEWSQIWSTFGEAETVGGTAANINESTQTVRQKYLKRLLMGTKNFNMDGINNVMLGISQTVRESYTASGANQSLNQRVSFMIRGLSQLLNSNIESFLGPQSSIPDMEIPISLLCECAIDEDLNSGTQSQAADALDGWLLLLLSSSKSITSEDQAHLYHTAFKGVHRQVFGKQDSKNPSVAFPVLSAEPVQLKALEVMKPLVELCGDKIRGEWAYVYETLLSVFPRTSPIFPDDLLDLRWDPVNNEHSETITRSSELVRAAFEVFQLIVADFVPEALLGKDLFPFTQMLHDFSLQRLDMNISLQSISAFYQCGLDMGMALKEASTQDTSRFLANPANKKTQLSWRNRNDTIETKTNEATAIDTLGSAPEYRWLSLTNALICITQDPRTEVRNAALKMAFKIIGLRKEHMDAYSFPVINKLLFVNRDAHENVRDPKNTGHIQGSSSLVENWNESSTIVLEQLSSLISPPPLSSKDLGQYKKGLGLIISQIAEYSEYSSPRLCTATYNALALVIEQNDSVISRDEDLLDQIWKLWLCSMPVVDSESSRLSHDVLLSWTALLDQIRLAHGSHFGLLQIDASLRSIVPWILYDSLPEYTSDKDLTTDFQTKVLQILKALIANDHDVLLQILYYCTVFSSLAQLVGRNGTSSKQTLIAFSKEAVDVERELLLRVVGDRIIYKQPDVIFSALIAASTQLRGKDERHAKIQKEKSIPQHAGDSIFQVLEKLLPLLPDLAISDFAKCLMVSGVLVIGRSIMYSGDIRKVSHTVNVKIGDTAWDIAEAEDINKLHAIHALLKTVIKSSNIYKSHALRYAQHLFEESKQHFLAPLEDFSARKTANILDIKCGQGRTYDPQLDKRDKMAKECFLFLADLASGNELENGECLYWGARKLLLYRILQPLEAYIWDQPLRGLLPLPMAYRQELILAMGLFKKSHKQNNTESKAGLQWRKDVSKLSPFVAQAIKIAQGDSELLEVFADISFITGSASYSDRSNSTSHEDYDEQDDCFEDKGESKQEDLQRSLVYTDSEMSSAWTDTQINLLRQLPGLFKTPKELDAEFLAIVKSHQASKEAYENARARNPGPKPYPVS